MINGPRIVITEDDIVKAKFSLEIAIKLVFN